MNRFMTPRVLINLGASCLAKRRTRAGAAADLKGCLEANTVFCVAVGASIVCFRNWFSSLSPDNVVDHRFWAVSGLPCPSWLAVAGFR